MHRKLKHNNKIDRIYFIEIGNFCIYLFIYVLNKTYSTAAVKTTDQPSTTIDPGTTDPPQNQQKEGKFAYEYQAE